MIEIREKIKALREQFKTETGENYINSQGEPDIEYMAWMEERLVKESDSLPCVSDCHEAKVAEYWHQRCKKAEAYINESPCDPAITDLQLTAWNDYQDFIAE